MVYFWIVFFIVGSPICLWLQHVQRQQKESETKSKQQKLDKLNSKEPGGEQDLYSTNTRQSYFDF